jgi:hypothetical protein
MGEFLPFFVLIDGLTFLNPNQSDNLLLAVTTDDGTVYMMDNTFCCLFLNIIILGNG